MLYVYARDAKLRFRPSAAESMGEPVTDVNIICIALDDKVLYYMYST